MKEKAKEDAIEKQPLIPLELPVVDPNLKDGLPVASLPDRVPLLLTSREPPEGGTNDPRVRPSKSSAEKVYPTLNKYSTGSGGARFSLGSGGFGSGTPSSNNSHDKLSLERDIYREIICNNSPRRLWARDEVMMATVETDSSHENDFLNAEYEAVSPNINTPALPGKQVMKISLELGMGDHKRQDMWYLFFALSTAICFELYLDLPVFVAISGGYWVLIPLAVCTVFVAWPMVILEVALGQYTTAIPAYIFGNIAPIFNAFSYLYTILRILRMLAVRTDPRTLYYAFDFFFALFFGERDATCRLHGKYCEVAVENEVYCNSTTNAKIAGTCFKPEIHSPRGHFVAQHGRMTVTFHPSVRTPSMNIWPGKPDPIHLLMCVLVVFLAHFGAKLRFSTISKLCSVLFLFPLICLFFVFPYIISNEIPFDYSLDNDWRQLTEPLVWIQALYLSLEMFSVGDSTWLILGTWLPFRYNAFKVVLPVFFISFVLALVSLLVAIPIYNVDISGVSAGGYLEFPTRYNFMRTMLGMQHEFKHTQYVLIPLSIAIYLSQMPYLIISIDNFCSRVIQEIPQLGRVDQIVGRHCIGGAFGLVLAIAMIYTSVSPLVYRIFAQWMEGVYPILIFCECIIVCYKYGLDRFMVNMQTMYGKYRIFGTIYPACIAMWKFSVPVAALVMTSLAVLHKTSLITPVSLGMIGFTSFVFLYGMVQVVRFCLLNIPTVYLLRVTSKWGPLNILNRKRANHDERAARIFS